MTDINIAVYDNEDLMRPFVLKTGESIDDAVPYSLVGAILEADIRDATGELIMRLTSVESAGIRVTDAAGGAFQFEVTQGGLTMAMKSLKYDLLLIVAGVYKRLWGGKITISKGVTVPP